MSDPAPTSDLPILADPTGRRGRRLAATGRVLATLLGLWLVVLAVGGLGLQPLRGLPVVGGLQPRGVEPGELPRVRAVVEGRRHLALPRSGGGASRAAPGPVAGGGSPVDRRPSSRAIAPRRRTTTSRAPKRPRVGPARSVPAATPAPTGAAGSTPPTTPATGARPQAAAPDGAPGGPGTTPAGSAPGGSAVAPGRGSGPPTDAGTSATAPGRTDTMPGAATPPQVRSGRTTTTP